MINYKLTKEDGEKLIAKKSLGQHFLRSEKALLQMKECVGKFDKEKEIIFEIGPGEGVLTEKLLELGGVVAVIEIDERSISLLQERFSKEISEKKLFIISKNCLDINYGEEIEKINSFVGSGFTKYILMGNIPYYITGAIFKSTFEQELLPVRSTFLVQKEVAERVVARDKKESVLSISVKIFSRSVEFVDVVKAGSFSPPPKVDSAILKMDEILNPFSNKEKYIKFFEILKTAFKYKRKYLLSNLKKDLGEDAFIFASKFFEEKERAEDVSVDRWMGIVSKIK